MTIQQKRRSLLLTSAIAGASFVALLSTATIARAADPVYRFDIPKEPLSQALKDFSQSSAQQIIFSEDVVRGREAPAVRGSYTSPQVLDLLLAGTNLAVERTPSGTIMVKSKDDKQRAQETRPTRLGDASQASPSGEDGQKLEEIVVTGTHIRGAAPVGSALSVYTRDDIKASGALTIDQFIQKLPQNYADVGQGTQSFSTNINSRTNLGYGASIDLMGLGTGSTLVLLDGHRMAPSGASGSFVDITTIPTGAVDRVEVLTDGASAIYGSDAVGGVVNFVLKKDYSGAETSALYGSDGSNYNEYRFSQLAGTQWHDGGGLISYQFTSNDPLRASDRSFAAGDSVPSETLLPGQTSNNVFASGHQSLNDQLESFAEVLYSNRDTKITQGDGGAPVADNSTTQQVNATAGVNYDFSSDWKASLSGTYSWNGLAIREPGNAAVFSSPFDGNFVENVMSIDATVNGALAELPAGKILFAAGVSDREENSRVQEFDPTTPPPFPWNSVSRNVAALFGELRVPIVSDANEIPFVHRLDFSVAGRYEHYSDFGDAAVPKVGLEYSPVAALTFRGTYSKSYRAPPLQDLIGGPGEAIIHLPTAFAAGLGVSPPYILEEEGSNPNLQAETSRTWTVGIDFKPEALPITAGITYFDVAYTNRIAVPTFTLLNPLTSPGAYGPLAIYNPSAAFVSQKIARAAFVDNFAGAYNPAAIGYFFNNSINNISTENENGLDVDLRSSFDGLGGHLDLGLSGVYIFSLQQGITPQAPLQSFLNTTQAPLRFRARGIVSWSSDGFGVTAAVNYANSYKNNTVTPVQNIASWTTMDLQLRYDTQNDVNRTWLNGISLAVSVNNLFDEAPPYALVAINSGHVAYDPTNATPLGRVVSFEVTKKW